MKVRRVTATDAAKVRALRLEMLADSPLAFIERIDEAAARPHDQFCARIAANAAGSQASQYIAVTEDGRVVGQAGGHPSTRDRSATVIFSVYISPPWRGNGVLARLVEAVAGWSQSIGRPVLELEVVVGNDRAVHAYEKLGFVDTGVRSAHPTVPTLTELTMRRAAAIRRS
jgi:GNAT superfamily N-acetyltransferase